MSEMAADGLPDQRSLPPVNEVCVASMVLIVIGGVYMAAHLPRHVPYGLPIAVIVGSFALIGWNALSVARLRAFAWDSFWLVARWSLVAYAVIAGMLEFVFLHGGTRGSQLVLVTLMLLAYAVNIPLLLAFSVARYQPPDA